MKKLGKALVLAVLSRQLKRLLAKHPVKIVGVVGSYGKTSTKLALATVLSAGLRVRHQDGNYNDIVTVPLIFFGEALPSLTNPIAWMRLFMRNRKQIKQDYPYDVVVVELGTDGPGQVAAFRRYLQLDVAVVTSIAYEHMEFFADVAAVAAEELSVMNYAKQTIVNRDLCDTAYLGDRKVVTYGVDGGDYQVVNAQVQGENVVFTVNKAGAQLLQASCINSSQNVLYSAGAAAAVGDTLGMAADTLAKGISTIQPAAGRMRKFTGLNGSIVLDDSYNASPEAVKASLDTLYATDASQRIALLGNMNELGSFSPAAHTDIGNYCNPSKLTEVLTLGPDANKYTAEAARQKGCKVTTFDSPFAAGRYMVEKLQPGTVVLVKGSQNKVFAEETVKLTLANPDDAKQLVRQGASWQKIKRKQFSDAA
ncbi:MAG: glutamate ligase domain-containing protein [Candidatus Saccharimonadales bacterium]